ncbi:MAG: flagellar hook-length control protein FliK [Spirochaetes bacterium]|nr:flagellar hook-length control protein FliK [Spirochaetota bacterium]
MINIVQLHPVQEEQPGTLRIEARGPQAPLVSFHEILRGRVQESGNSAGSFQQEEAASPRPEQPSEQAALHDTGRINSESRNEEENTARTDRPEAETPAQETPRSRDTERQTSREGRADAAEAKQGEQRSSERKERTEAESTGALTLEQHRMPGNAPAERKPSVESLPRPADTTSRRHGIREKSLQNLGASLQELISLMGARNVQGERGADLRAEVLPQGRSKPRTGRIEQNLRQSLQQLKELINRIESDRGKQNREQLPGRTMSQLQMLLRHLTAAQEKGRQEPASPAISSEIRELSSRIASLVGSIRQEQAGRQSTDDGAQQGLNPGLYRNDTLLRRAAVPQAGQTYGGQFQDQLQSMLEQARISVRDSGNATLAMRLHPRELGSMNINLGLEQGVINGRFTVETEDARQLLLQNLEFIRSEMEQAGITVGNFQVNVSGGGEQYSEGEAGHGSATAPQVPEAQIAASYGMGAQVLHEGGINVII